MLHGKFKQNLLLAAQIHTTAQIYLELQFCVELLVKKTSGPTMLTLCLLHNFYRCKYLCLSDTIIKNLLTYIPNLSVENKRHIYWPMLSRSMRMLAGDWLSSALINELLSTALTRWPAVSLCPLLVKSCHDVTWSRDRSWLPADSIVCTQHSRSEYSQCIGLSAR